MTTPTFTTPPAVIPARGSSTFSTDASAWVTWQNGFEGELSTATPWVAARVVEVAQSVTDATTQVGLATAQVGLATAQVGLATTQAGNAAASAAAAVVTSNADLWVSGASYSAGDNVISEVDFGTYRSITTHTGVATDPSADATNWTLISAGAGSSVAALTPAATVDISLADDDYFTITLDQDTTFTVSDVDAGVDTFNLAITGAEVVNGYDLANAVYNSVSFSVASQDGSPSGLFFKPDGTKMYMAGYVNDAIYQYTLSTAWDLSTASYDSISLSVVSQDNAPMGLTFKPDGTKMYMAGFGGSIYQYTLSTAWDLSTASYDSVSFSVTSQAPQPRSVTFKPDGTKMYWASSNTNSVYQYTLSTAWDLSTASYDSASFSAASQETQVQSILFKPDGAKMYVVGAGSDAVLQYSLSTAWVVSSAVYDSVSFSVASQESSPQAMFFDPDGSKLYVVGLTNKIIYQYTMATTAAPATTTFPASFVFTSGSTPAAPANGVTDILEAQTTNGGTTWVVSQFGSGKATSYQDAVVVLTGATPTVNLAAAGEYRLTTSGNTTFTVSNPPADGYTTTKTLRITQGGTAYSLTFWAGIEAIGGAIPAAPALNETKEYTLRASTVSGTTIYVLTETGVVS